MGIDESHRANQDTLSRAMDEMAFRELIDANGFLKEGADTRAWLGSSFLVFSQKASASFALDEWRTQARSFFSSEIGFSVDKKGGRGGRAIDAAHVVLSCPSGNGARLVVASPLEQDHITLADAADTGGGLSDLARRCKSVLHVEAMGDTDGVALTLAALVASIFLGPILSVDRSELFGVRTARTKLETLASAYR